MKYRSLNTIQIFFSARKHYNTENSVHYTVNGYVKFTVQILNVEIHSSVISTERLYIFSFCVQYTHFRVSGKYPRNSSLSHCKGKDLYYLRLLLTNMAALIILIQYPQIWTVEKNIRSASWKCWPHGQ